jgi:outer membrane receptor protein involved in Fe transport
LSQLPLSEIFSPENIRTQNGFVLEEGTRPIDSYTASNLLAAGFIGFELPYKRFDIAGGLRYEYNLQKLNTRDDIQEINEESPIGSILPFANIGYSLSERSILRLGYSRTVNRPEFRELAPYLFYDFEYEAGRIGNPELETATIDNIDFRYEFYPSVGETISLGAFYKQFDNPIETRNIIVTEQPLFNYINADEATVYGFELEFKKSFRGLTNSAFVDRFLGNINASLIFSEVDLGESAVAQDRVRDLQGQSPYIINAAINYADDKDLIVNAVFNRFGDRIFAVGDDNSPTIYELSRNSLDLSVTKKFNERYTVKFGVQDLLNAEFRFFEDSNANFKIDSDDNPISTFKRGQLFNFTITYSIF